jgi:rhamnosyltransferase
VAKSKFYHGAKAPYLVDVIISSGTTATKEVFQVAGGFDEDLYIDYVDTDWCLRCREKNIPIRIVPSAVMYHRVGMNSANMGLLTVQVHSPERCYYQIRNSFNLFRRPYIPFLFAAQELLYTLINRVFLLFIVKQRSLYVRAYFRAISDGLMGVVGPK